MTTYRYEYDDAVSTIGILYLDGEAIRKVDSETDAQLHGYLNTQRWMDALNAGEISFDAATGILSIDTKGVKVDIVPVVAVEDSPVTDFADRLSAIDGSKPDVATAKLELLREFFLTTLKEMGRL